MTDPTSLAQDQVPELTGWQTYLRDRLTRDYPAKERRDYGFMLTDEPLTKAQVKRLFRAALWERFSGWDYDDDQAADALADALEAARPGMFR